MAVEPTEAMRERARQVAALVLDRRDEFEIEDFNEDGPASTSLEPTFLADIIAETVAAALAEAVAAEREACANVADPRAVEVPGAFGKTRTFIVGCQDIAAAIRARGGGQ